jgi:acetyl-CoA acyltransferase
MRDVVIVEAVRSAFGKRNGSLAEVHAVNLASLVLNEVVERANVPSHVVEYVVWGCVSQVGEQGINIARNAMLTAGYPMTIPATSVDLQCGSSQQATHFAANLIQSDVVDVAIAGGVESMTRVPMGSNIAVAGNPYPAELRAQYVLTSQGISAEKVADKWGIKREDADRFAVESQRRATIARDEGYFSREIVPVAFTKEGAEGTLSQDEGIRPGTSMEGLANLKPSFRENGVHHAGNSSQITDGASAVLLMSADKAKELGVKARARIVAQTVVGTDPELMLTGPIEATPKVLKRAGMTLDQMDEIEINEAFASVVLAWQKEMDPDMSKVNPNGGAVALGHPLGATGARLITTCLHELERTGGRYGLITMCCGGGLGTGTVIERLD